MLSRVASAIYWMSRYVERAENVARFIDVNLSMLHDLPDGQDAQWEPLVSATADDAVFLERYKEPTRENVIDFLTFDESCPNSILACLRMARENARSIRETISEEMWEAINRFYLMVTEAARARDSISSLHAFFAEIKSSSHQFVGDGATTMNHGEGWQFLKLGALIERADKTSRVLDVKYYYLLPAAGDVGTVVDVVQWSAVLRSVSGLSAHRQRYSRITPANVVEFLLLDLEFPRAAHHCLVSAEQSLRKLSGSPQGTFQNAAEQRLGRVRAELDYAAVDELIHGGLHEYIDEFQAKLNRVGEGIQEAYFDLKPIGGTGAWSGSFVQ